MTQQLLLKKLKITNFLSHKSTKIDFDEHCRILIDGKSGAGKSSIIDSIIWVLYNKSRSNNKSLIRTKAKTATVELVLSRGSDKYRIVRTVTSAGKHELEVFLNESPAIAAGTREKQEYIEINILASSYELFVNSIAYPQDNTDSFVKQSQSKRKDILLEILRTSSFDDLLKSTKDKYSVVAKQLNELSNQWSGLAWRVEDKKTRLEELIKNVKPTAYLNERIKKLKDDLCVLDKDIEETKHIEHNLELLEIAKRHKQDLVARGLYLNRELEKIEGFDLKGKEEEILALPRLLNNRTYYEITEKINTLRSTPSFTCKYCGEVNSYIVESAFASLYEELKEKCGECPVLEFNTLKDVNNRIKELEGIKSSIETFKVINRDRDSIVREEKDVREKVLSLEKEIIRLSSLTLMPSGKKMDLAQKKQTIESSIRSLEIELSNIERINREIDVLKSDIGTTSANLNTVNKLMEDSANDIASLELLKDALGPNGIKAIVTEMVLPSLEAKINSVLSTLSDMRIRLETEKDNSKEDGVVDGLFIYLINENGEEMEISNYSGGERVKIVTSISEGLASMQNVGFRLLDEAIIGLDDDTVESFAGVIGTIGKTFSQLICISHLPRIKELFSERLNIIKVGGISQVEEILL